MAEPIGLAAGVIAIAETGFKLSKTLYEVGSSVVNARTELNDLARELDNFAGVLISVGEIVQEGSSDNLQRPEHLIRATEKVLERCGAEFEKIRQMVHLPVGHSVPCWDRLRWPFHKSKTTKLKVSLEYSKSSLMIMLQTLHIAIGLHALRSLEKISDSTDMPEGANAHQTKKRMLPDGVTSIRHQEDTSSYAASDEDGVPNLAAGTNEINYIDSAQLIVRNTVSVMCGSEGQPTFDFRSFHIIEAEIQKIVAEYSASSQAFSDKIFNGNISKTLDTFKRMSMSELLQQVPELDNNKDIGLMNELKDLEGDLEVLNSIFLAQRQLLKDMIEACNDLCGGQRLLSATNSLYGVSSLIDGCKSQVVSMLETCRATIRNFDSLIQAKQHRMIVVGGTSNQSSETSIKMMTLLTFIFLPMTFVSSLFTVGLVDIPSVYLSEGRLPSFIDLVLSTPALICFGVSALSVLVSLLWGLFSGSQKLSLFQRLIRSQ